MRNDNPWWSLPGPGRFLESVTADLQSGRNVLLALPEHHPPGLRNALSDRLRDSDGPYLRALDLRDEPPDAALAPTRFLHDRLAPLSDPGVDPSPRTVALAPSLCGTALWVDGISDDAWPAWRLFLDHYKDACRMRRDFERFLLIVPTVGRPTEHLPREELTLAIHRWEGAVGRIDMLLDAVRAIDRAHLPPLLNDLAVSVTVEVAGTDPHLVDRLAAAPVEEILDPLAVIRDEAKRRGWLDRPPSWSAGSEWRRGMVDRINGRAILHSAAEVAAGRTEVVSRRVWRGQIAVLFPFIEEHRLRFIREFRPLLSVPVQTAYESIPDHESLELSHLFHQLRKKVSARRLEPLEHCLHIRNSLAHLRPVKAAVILSPAFDGLVRMG